MPYADSNTRRAIDRHLAHQDTTARELAAVLGVTQQTLSRWRSGKQQISDPNWIRLHEVLGEEPPLTSSLTRAPEARRTIVPVPESALVPVPVLGTAAAAGYEPALEPLGEFLHGFDEETDDWPAAVVKPGYFCLRVSGDSMSPEFVDGTILLVAGGEFPERGDIVVARLSDLGEVVVKHYHRRNGIVELQAQHPEGKSYTIDVKAEPGRLLWMWPVVQARIDLRRRRQERHAGGN